MALYCNEKSIKEPKPGKRTLIQSTLPYVSIEDYEPVQVILVNVRGRKNKLPPVDRTLFPELPDSVASGPFFSPKRDFTEAFMQEIEGNGSNTDSIHGSGSGQRKKHTLIKLDRDYIGDRLTLRIGKHFRSIKDNIINPNSFFNCRICTISRDKCFDEYLPYTILCKSKMYLKNIKIFGDFGKAFVPTMNRVIDDRCHWDYVQWMFGFYYAYRDNKCDEARVDVMHNAIYLFIYVLALDRINSKCTKCLASNTTDFRPSPHENNGCQLISKDKRKLYATACSNIAS